MNILVSIGEGIVVSTGTDTEVGKIASMIQAVPDFKTPLQIRLDKLGKSLAWASLAACVIIFIVGIIYGHELLSMFMTAVSLAAAAIPEGLPAVSTIVLTRCTRILDNGAVRAITPQDAQRLASENAQMANEALRVLCMAYKGTLLLLYPLSKRDQGTLICASRYSWVPLIYHGR